MTLISFNDERGHAPPGRRRIFLTMVIDRQ